MIRQYRKIKSQYKDAVLFFRLGDFYEMFEKDAEEVSRILNLTLTSRHGVPMCGIPYHAAENYIPRLLKTGKKIWPRMLNQEPPFFGRGNRGIRREREVVEGYNPGEQYSTEGTYFKPGIPTIILRAIGCQGRDGLLCITVDSCQPLNSGHIIPTGELVLLKLRRRD